MVHVCVWRCQQERFALSLGRAGLVLPHPNHEDSLIPVTAVTSVEKGDIMHTTVAIGAAVAGAVITAGQGALSLKSL